MKITHQRLQSEMGPVPGFTGPIQAELIAFNDPSSELQVLKVHFAPGSRTDWHMHPKGQILYVAEGIGLVQEENDVLYEVKAGDTIIAEPGKWHWHGASASSPMAHYAIYEKSEVVHGSLVDDEQYMTSPIQPGILD
jgi:quercetin dioxygenase-like cupin family protein